MCGNTIHTLLDSYIKNDLKIYHISLTMPTQLSNITFTSFSEPSIDTKKVAFYVYQKEKCPKTEKIHWQGYMELKKRCTLNTIKQKIFNDDKIHIEERKGSQKQNITYCTKKESQIENPVFFGTPKEQGHRSDLDEIARLAPTTSVRTLIEKYKGNALRHINMIMRYQRILYNPCDLELYLRSIENKDLTINKAISDWTTSQLPI